MQNINNLIKDYINVVTLRNNETSKIEQEMKAYIESREINKLSTEVLNNIYMNQNISIDVKKTIHKKIFNSNCIENVEKIDFSQDIGPSILFLQSLINELDKINFEFNSIISEYTQIYRIIKNEPIENLYKLKENFDKLNNDPFLIAIENQIEKYKK